MFAGLGFGGYIVTILIAWLIQRETLKKSTSSSLPETLFIFLFLPIANVVLSVIFWFAANGQIGAEWIKKNIYQIK